MDSRKQFEEWLCSFPIKPDLRMNGDMYKNKHVESRWIGWQAGRASMRDEGVKDDKWACHIDLEDGQEPDNCVLDGGERDHCIYARKYGDDARKYCGEWKPIKVHKIQP